MFTIVHNETIYEQAPEIDLQPEIDMDYYFDKIKALKNEINDYARALEKYVEEEDTTETMFNEYFNRNISKAFKTINELKWYPLAEHLIAKNIADEDDKLSYSGKRYRANWLDGASTLIQHNQPKLAYEILRHFDAETLNEWRDNDYNGSFLHLAAKNEQFELVCQLIELGMDVNTRDRDKDLFVVYLHGKSNILELLKGIEEKAYKANQFIDLSKRNHFHNNFFTRILGKINDTTDEMIRYCVKEYPQYDIPNMMMPDGKTTFAQLCYDIFGKEYVADVFGEERADMIEQERERNNEEEDDEEQQRPYRLIPSHEWSSDEEDDFPAYNPHDFESDNEEEDTDNEEEDTDNEDEDTDNEEEDTDNEEENDYIEY